MASPKGKISVSKMTAPIKVAENDTMRVTSKPVEITGKFPSYKSVRDRTGDFPTKKADADLRRKAMLRERGK